MPFCVSSAPTAGPDDLGADDLEVAEIRPCAAPSSTAWAVDAQRRCPARRRPAAGGSSPGAAPGRRRSGRSLLAAAGIVAGQRLAHRFDRRACSNWTMTNVPPEKSMPERDALGRDHADAGEDDDQDRAMACQRQRRKSKLGVLKNLHRRCLLDPERRRPVAAPAETPARTASATRTSR